MSRRSIAGLTAAVMTAAALTGCKDGPLGIFNQKTDEPVYKIEDYQDKATVRKNFNESLDFGKTLAAIPGAPADFQWVGEAEDAELTGVVREMTGDFEGYSGRGYVGSFTDEKDAVTFTAEVPADGIYDLTFRTSTGYSDSHKINPVEVDGHAVGSITSPESEEFVDAALEGIYLSAGSHRITAGTEWGYYYIDRLTLTPGKGIDDKVYSISTPLCDQNAFDNTKRLYEFLRDCYGKYTLTGQYCDKGKFGTEMTLIHDKTGSYPAILGLDMMDYTPSRTEHGSKGRSVDYAKDFYLNAGGIVTMCWHWNAPSAYLPNTDDKPWYSGFYADKTTIDLDKIADGSDSAGKTALLADIDAVCAAMEPLKEAQVPILWRPLHEASGGWFWWGNCKPESYLWLWNQLYQKMVGEHGLHNLIWVWNGQDKAWYPGDETVDIIGTDIYAPAHSYASQSSTFTQMTGWSGTPKLLALSENGVMPDPELLRRDRAMWSWFGTWGGEFVHDKHIASEQYTDFAMWEKVYKSGDTLTLEELPCLWTYRKEHNEK